MNRIARWLEKRRAQRMKKYIDGIRAGTEQEKKAFLVTSLLKAYAPLHFAMTTLQAENFVTGTIHEQTKGEWFRIEMRKIEKPLNDSK